MKRRLFIAVIHTACRQIPEFVKRDVEFDFNPVIPIDIDGLREAWDGVVKDLGKFKKHGEVTINEAEDGTLEVSLISEYEKTNLRTQLNINENGEIIAVWFFFVDPSDTEGPALSDSELKEAGKKYFNLMRTGDFGGITTYFTSDLKNGLSAGALREAWASTTGNLGAFKSITDVDLVKNGNTVEVSVHASFQESVLKTTFIYTASGKVCNLNNWAVARAVTPQGLVDEMIQIITEKNFAELNTRLGNGFDFGAYFSNYIFQTGDGIAENDRTISGFTRTWVSQQPWWTVMELDLQMSDGAKYLPTFEYNANNYNLNGFWCSRIASADELIAEAASFIRYAQANEYDWWTQRFVSSYDLQTDLNNNFFSYVDENGVTQSRTIVSYDGGTLTEFSDCLRADVTFTFSDGKVFTFHFPYDFNGINLLNLWYDDVTPAPAAVAAEEEEVPAEEPAEEPVEEPTEEPIETPEPAEQEEAALPDENDLPEAASAPEEEEPEAPVTEEPTEA